MVLRLRSIKLRSLISVILVFTLIGCSDEEEGVLRVAINSGPEGAAIRDLYKDYDADGVVIELVEFGYSPLREHLVGSMKSGSSNFDIVMIDDPWFPQLAENLRELGNVPPELESDIVSKSLALARVPYGSGTLKAMPYVGNTQLLFVRTDLLKNRDVNPALGSWQQVLTTARALTDADRDSFGYAIRGRSGAPVVTDFLPIYWSLGGDVTALVDGKRQVSLDRKLYEQALEIYYELLTLSPPGASNFDWTEMTAAFTAGRSAIELNWPAAIPGIDDALGGEQFEKKWGIHLPPGGEGSAPGTSMIGNWLLAVPEDSNSPEEAEKFIYWLMDNQHVTANEGRPPTRRSVFDALARERPYFTIIREALELSTPRDRTPVWSQIEEALSNSVTGYLIEPDNFSSNFETLETRLSAIFGN